MANKTVSLVRLCKTTEGWRRLPVVISKNGKIRPDYALFNGQPVEFLDGHYELRTYEGKKTVYRNVGNNVTEALAAQQRESHLLSAKHAAVVAGVQIVSPVVSRNTLQKRRDEFIERHVTKGHVRAPDTARIAINDFLEATGHIYAEQITDESILTFYKHLRKKKNQDRTIYNKHVSLFGWFKWMKLDVKTLTDRPPKYTKREVQEYSTDDIKALFAVCNEYQRVVFETLLKTGMRMQEGIHLEWVNLDLKTKRVKVRERLDSDLPGVNIKDRAERSIPLPDDLVATLKKWRIKHPKSRLVLGTRNDTPNWKWLPMLKLLAKRAGLNCNHCIGCRKNGECSHWKLKTFRSTYLTTVLRNGVDPRTIMEWSGHDDLATLMKYLAPSKDPSLQKKISSIKWS